MICFSIFSTLAQERARTWLGENKQKKNHPPLQPFSKTHNLGYITTTWNESVRSLRFFFFTEHLEETRETYVARTSDRSSSLSP